MGSEYTDAQKKASMKYQKENQVAITIRVRPEERARIKAAAEAAGESFRGFILDAIDKKMNGTL